MNALRLLVAGAMVCAVTAGARAEDKKADNAKAILGSWEAVKADPGTLPVGAVVEFATGGKMKVTAKREGKEETHEAVYAVDGDKITITMKMGDNVNKFDITIKKISDAEMTAVNAEGKVVEFKKKK
jgi:uncharacterized protein (TIGR03066 family)